MKNILWLLVVVSNISFAQKAEFPTGPIAQLTPGELCSTPSEYRYREHIAYCERDVLPELKTQIFSSYRRMGFRLNVQDRSKYKIDHYIPLCAGGANTPENLWPQHISIANITDSIEEMGCTKMALGRLSQAKFVSYIKRVKNDLSQAQRIKQEIARL